MKLSYLIIGASLFMVVNTCWSMLPPKYLSVPHWQRCVSTKTRGTAQFVCLPRAKPMNCSNESWERLTGEHLLDNCFK